MLKLLTSFFLFIGSIGFSQELYKEGWVLTRYYSLTDEAEVFENFQPIFPWGPHTHGDHFYTHWDNVNFNDNNISLEAIKERKEGEIWMWDEDGNFFVETDTFDYTSGLLYGLESFKYGLFEISVKANSVKGTNGAFWLYGDDNEEIDVFELRGSEPNRAQMTLHWKERDPLTRSKQSIHNEYLDSGLFTDDFYRMGVIWKEDQLHWLLNGDTVRVSGWERFIRSRHIPKNELNLIASLEVNTIDGEPESTGFPDQVFFKDITVYSDTLQVPAPTIIGQEIVNHDFADTLDFNEAWLKVKDHYGFFPIGHRVEILDGNDYVLENDNIIITSPSKTEIYINVLVNNGIDNSDVYAFEVLNTKTTIAEFIEAAGLKFISKPNELWIKNLSSSLQKIKIYNTTGQKISSLKLAPETETLIPSINEKSLIVKSQSGLKSNVYKVVLP